MRFLVLFVPLSLMGCQKITFSDLDKFGNIKSAVWLDLSVDAEYEDEVEESNTLILSNRPGLCKTLKKVMPEAAVHSDKTMAFVYGDDYDYDNYCTAYKEFASYLAEEMDKYLKADSQMVNFDLIEVKDGDYEWGIEPSSGTFAASKGFDADDGSYFSGYVNSYKSNPYALLKDALKDEYGDYGCWADDEAYETGVDDAVEWWNAEEGNLELTVKGKKVKGVFEGLKLEDSEEKSAGDMSGNFAATQCQIDLKTDYDFYMSWF